MCGVPGLLRCTRALAGYVDPFRTGHFDSWVINTHCCEEEQARAKDEINVPIALSAFRDKSVKKKKKKKFDF